mmetsp:Transcript_789/g.2121  ORF Transcript_789/g.2121 Transcript_789/m.2121 type:complete len:232 (+) Transcript_789:112-807(+)
MGVRLLHRAAIRHSTVTTITLSCSWSLHPHHSMVTLVHHDLYNHTASCHASTSLKSDVHTMAPFIILLVLLLTATTIMLLSASAVQGGVVALRGLLLLLVAQHGRPDLRGHLLVEPDARGLLRLVLRHARGSSRLRRTRAVRAGRLRSVPRHLLPPLLRRGRSGLHVRAGAGQLGGLVQQARCLVPCRATTLRALRTGWRRLHAHLLRHPEPPAAEVALVAQPLCTCLAPC